MEKLTKEDIVKDIHDIIEYLAQKAAKYTDIKREDTTLSEFEYYMPFLSIKDSLQHCIRLLKKLGLEYLE